MPTNSARPLSSAVLGDLARIAARTATDFVRATLGEPEVAEGRLDWLHAAKWADGG